MTRPFVISRVLAASAVLLSAGPALAAEPVEEFIDCPPGAVCEELELAPPEPEPPKSDVAGGQANNPPLPPQPWPLPPLAHEPWPQPYDEMSPDPGVPLAEVGVGVFALGYVPAFIAAIYATSVASDEEDPVRAQESRKLTPLLLPVAGPPITAAIADVGVGGTLLLAASAGVQAAGLIMAAVGWLSGETEPGSASRLRPVVMGDRHAVGLGVAGSF